MNQAVTGAPGGFKDRGLGLIVVGVLVVAVGCICALFAAFAALVALVGPRAATPGVRVLPAVLLYTALAVAFIWLGIGSIVARRWARALLLMLAWFWLLDGIVTVPVMAVFLPKALAGRPPGGEPMSAQVATAIVAGALVAMSVIFILLPGLLVLFYRSPHVKATCEARDRITRWTDRCPLPVLALSLMLGLGAAWMLAMAGVYHGVVPLFGRLVNGPTGSAILVAMAALWAYCARATYRLDPRGWWIVLVAIGVSTMSATLTFLRMDPVEMFRMMGYSAQELATMDQLRSVFGQAMIPITLAGAVLWFGYLLFVKRYFRRPA